MPCLRELKTGSEKMTNTINFSNKFNHTTIFTHVEAEIWLTRLWGMKCGLNGLDTGPLNTRGFCVLETAERRYEGKDFELQDFRHEADRLDLGWKVGDSGLLWHSHWQAELETGIWSRRDRLENGSEVGVELRRCMARFSFSPGRYEVYTQASAWARENQGGWNHFLGGRLGLGSRSGRTTQIANPYLFLREFGGDHGIAFHVLPGGNWAIYIDQTNTDRDELSPFNVVELGLSDRILRMKLGPGDRLALPEILIQDVPSGQPEAGSATLHYYLLTKRLRNQKMPPVVYNTWFDHFDSLKVDRLRAQLAGAQKIGCEIFVVDAGWYGAGEGNWHRQVGDWREKPDEAFHGKMKEFAEEVRDRGLRFGLWVEPERNSPDAPVVRAHPEWFRAGLAGFFYPDFSQPAVYDHILTELSSLIETYQLAWMKVDFNFELGDQDDEFYGYFERWYQLLDELRAKYPNTFLEGCASGGMRLDLNTLSHFDGYFLSDTVHPVDVLRITQGALLRLPPGRMTKWAVLRSQNNEVFTPGGASWEHAVPVDVDFICRVALAGMFGLSGDLISLSNETLARLAVHIRFYKEWRPFIHNSVCHLLTPVRVLDDDSGWIGFQLQNPSQPGTSLLFVYRLLDEARSKSFQLMNVEKNQTYTVTNVDAPYFSPSLPGHELHLSGLTVDLPHPNSAAIRIIKKAGTVVPGVG